MDKERWWLVGLVVLGLLAGSALACGLGAPSAPLPAEETPAVEATPPPPPPPEEEETPEAVETPEEEELPFALEEEALNNLDSYAYHFRMEFKGVTAGELESGTFEGEGKVQNRPTRAEWVTWRSTSEGETTAMEWIYIEDEQKMWTRTDEEEWVEIPMTDPSMFESFTLLGFWGSLAFAEPESTAFVGLETVNGVPTRHYRAEQFALGVECTFTTASQEWWIAVDGNWPVKGTIDAEGTCEGESGEYHFLEEISNVNQPVDISPPM